MNAVYVIEQFTGYQFERIPEGEFDTEEEATEAMQMLENDLGWSDMRVSRTE